MGPSQIFHLSHLHYCKDQNCVLWCDWQSILAGEPSITSPTAPDPAGCLLDPGHRGGGDPPGPTHPHTQEHFLSVKSMIPAKVIPWEKPNMLQLALGRTVSEGFRHSAFNQYGWREDFSPKIYQQISCKYCCLDVECGLQRCPFSYCCEESGDKE